MSESHAFNMDCMEALKEFPDKFFQIACVDPPYGGACSQAVKVERERESCTAARQILNKENVHGSEGGLTATISATRTGGTWARKYQRERQRRRMRIFAIGI